MKILNSIILFASLDCYWILNIQASYLKEQIREKDASLNVGYHIVSPSNHEYKYSKHAHRLFTPASNTKLFTAAAAFYFLGANFTFKTLLLADSQVLEPVVHGNFYIRFSGDPSLTQQDLVELLSELQKRSVSVIDGDIYLVAEVEDNHEEYFGPGFCVDDIGQLYNPPLSAYIVDGNICNGLDNKKCVVTNPREHVSNLIRNILRQFNITLSGTIKVNTTSSCADHAISCHASKPLYELISRMLKKSDNLYANAIFKYVGKVVNGLEGSWRTGQDAMKKFVEKCLQINSNELVIKDGAGLSRYNLISPTQIVKLLTWVYQQHDLFPIFVDCLAVSGVDGTLKSRMVDYKGIVKAKTGTISGVSSLSGYICLPQSEPYIFSIMLNGFIQQKIDEGSLVVNYKSDIEDAICTAVINELKSCASPDLSSTGVHHA